MSGYELLNLLELDDVGAPVEGLEVRLARELLGGRDLGMSHFRYAPGARSLSHLHEHEEEAYLVVAGSGRIRLDDELRDLRQWDVVRVAPEVVRGFEAGPDGLEVVAVGGPKSEGGDGKGSDRPWPGESA